MRITRTVPVAEVTWLLSVFASILIGVIPISFVCTLVDTALIYVYVPIDPVDVSTITNVAVPESPNTRGGILLPSLVLAVHVFCNW